MQYKNCISHHDATVQLCKDDPQFAVYFLVSSLKDCTEQEIAVTMDRLVLAFDGKLASGVTTALLSKTYIGKHLDEPATDHLSLEALIKSLGINRSILDEYHAMKIAA